MAPNPASQSIPDGQLLTGHLAEWDELLLLLEERRGLTVIVADPLSGTSQLLAAALKQSTLPSIRVDARCCANSLDLAMAIADGAIAALAPDASAWQPTARRRHGLAASRAHLGDRRPPPIRLRPRTRPTLGAPSTVLCPNPRKARISGRVEISHPDAGHGTGGMRCSAIAAATLGAAGQRRGAGVISRRSQDGLRMALVTAARASS